MSASSDALADRAAELAAAVRLSTNDPADAVRLLLPLVNFEPSLVPGSGPLAQNILASQAAIADTLRCAACAALGEAVRQYQPVSYQDAQALRKLACDAVDSESIRAADAGRDATYQALRALRTAIAFDLAIRGANLARLVEVQTRAVMPSLAEAWTLYQDTAREPQLVGSADPAHPLFLPLEFHALSE